MTQAGPTTLGEWISRVLLGMNVYECILYAAHGKDKAMWVHHLLTLLVSGWQAHLRQAVFWATLAITVEGTTPLLQLTKTMKENGYTHESEYKVAMSSSLGAWIVLRLIIPPFVLICMWRDFFVGGIPDTQSMALFYTFSGMYIGILGLSTMWFCKLAAIVKQVVRGDKKA